MNGKVETRTLGFSSTVLLAGFGIQVCTLPANVTAGNLSEGSGVPALEEELVTGQVCRKQVGTGAAGAAVLLSLVILKLETTAGTCSHLQPRNRVLDDESRIYPPACVCGSIPGGWSTGSLSKLTA